LKTLVEIGLLETKNAYLAASARVLDSATVPSPFISPLEFG
jgi:hypothetical protein